MKKSLLVAASLFSLVVTSSASAYYCSECGSYTSSSPSNSYSDDDRDGSYYRNGNDNRYTDDRGYYRGDRYPKPAQYNDQSNFREDFRNGSSDNRYESNQRFDNSGRVYPKPAQYNDQSNFRDDSRDGSYDNRDDNTQRFDNSGRAYPKPQERGYDDADNNNNDRRVDSRDQNRADQDNSKKTKTEDDRKIHTALLKNVTDKKIVTYPERLQIWIIDGEATLRGSVKNEDEKAKLKDFVKGQEGVKSVTDKVTVDSNANR